MLNYTKKLFFSYCIYSEIWKNRWFYEIIYEIHLIFVFKFSHEN
ncbi:MAG: hypothetical protein H6Q20_1039 [Bacteroidetes bacterium]|nr:hypothetical protein [Bacteroidota bacterium]